MKHSFTKYLFVSLLLLCISNFTPAQGLVWHQLGGPMGGIIGDLAINSEGDIYAGVYKYAGTGFRLKYYSGIYKSTDNGDTWKELNTQFEPLETYAIYITKEDDILVGTNHQGRIYRSKDDGETWENNNDGYESGECWAFGESNDGVLFTGNGEGDVYRSLDNGNSWEYSDNLMALIFATDSNNVVYCGTQVGLYKTTDNGLNWLMNGSFAGTAVSSVLIDDNNNIYIGTGYYDNGNGVYYSTNGGGNWSSLGLDDQVILSLAFDTSGNLYAGTKQQGLFKTTDLGKTWAQFQNGLSSIQVFRLKINNQDDIFIGSENEGVFRSTNGGVSFKEVGLPISNIKNIDFSIDKNLIFTSTPSGVQVYNRVTGNWENRGLREVEAVSVSPSGDLYAATYLDGVYRSKDYGKTWERLITAIDYRYNFKAITDSILIDAVFPTYRLSNDKGISWEISDINPDPSACSILHNYDNNTIYIQGFRDGYKIFSTTDFGQTVSELITTPSSRSSQNAIAVNSFKDLFFTCRESEIYGIYLSSYPYANWSKLYTGKAYSILVDTNDYVYAAVDSGIYFSTNNGNDWEYIFTENMPRTFAEELKKEGNNLYIATNSYGLYEFQIPTHVKNESDMVKDYQLYQNYPNPFNSSTMIKYSVAHSGTVKIKIYNILGKEIKSLVNKYNQAGTYEVQFNSEGIPSGVYFYRIRCSTYSETKKMILFR